MNIESVKKLCHQLRLFGFHQTLEKRTQEAMASSLHPLESLKLLLEDEALFRKKSIAKVLKTKAKFRSEVSADEWDQSYDRGLSKAKLKELLSLGFYHTKENLILNGPTGAGKTHLAIALGHRLCHEAVQPMFYSTNLFFEEVNAQKAAGKYLPFIKKLCKVQVIILDDFGLRNYTHEEATVLIDLLEDRYQKGIVMVTSQVSPTGWSKLFEDPVIAEAIVNRLVHPARVVPLKGPSYRERLKKQN
jgi:DNA replication protein DnaC